MKDLLGWRDTSGAKAKTKETCESLFGGKAIAPNISDVGSATSMKFAAHAYGLLKIPMTKMAKPLDDDSGTSASGTELEKKIEENLEAELKKKARSRDWSVNRVGTVAQFSQFTHLNDLQEILDTHPTIRATYAGDYQVKTDVWISLPNKREPEHRFLHAAIASKWTIRSDRVQNVRHEFAMLIRNRRGRAPHLVLVTAEPLPSRVLSIARGTGEIDAVYHVLFDEINSAVSHLCADGELPVQKAAWDEMVDQERLLPYSQLCEDLILS